MTISGIVAFVLVFGAIVLVHEVGHFSVAKLMGIMVRDFSIGLGPVILRVRRSGTWYSLRALPLGGFVRLEGMENAAESPAGPEEPLPASDSRRFANRPLWQRMSTIAAGPVMNLVLAGVMLAFLFRPPVVQRVLPGLPADRAGIQPGDRIVQVDSLRTPTQTRVVRAVFQKPPGQSVQVWVERDGRQLSFTVPIIEDAGRGVIGIEMGGRGGPVEALVGGFVEMVDLAGEIVRALVLTFRGLMPFTVTGPVGIYSMVQEAASYGPGNLIRLAAFLSINLGLINLLPVPVLDGGWLFFMAIEWVRRRPLEPEVHTIAQLVGLAFLVGLMLLATYFDLLRVG